MRICARPSVDDACIVGTKDRAEEVGGRPPRVSHLGPRRIAVVIAGVRSVNAKGRAKEWGVGAT